MSRTKGQDRPLFDELAAYLEGAVEAALGRQATVTGIQSTAEFDRVTMNIEVMLTKEVKKQ